MQPSGTLCPAALSVVSAPRHPTPAFGSSLLHARAVSEMLLIVWRAVYHVTKDGWKKVRGDDVGQLHYKYYPAPEAHPCAGTDPLEA